MVLVASCTHPEMRLPSARTFVSAHCSVGCGAHASTRCCTEELDGSDVSVAPSQAAVTTHHGPLALSVGLPPVRCRPSQCETMQLHSASDG